MKYSRRSFLKAAGFTVASLSFVSAASAFRSFKKIPGTKQRNVIFILSDDHRYDFMGFMNKVKFLKTPNMDRMAKEGAHIENAFVTTSLCSPSRASILTGQFSHKHGVVDNNTMVPEGTEFFPQYLQQVGYQTAMMGKWHMGHGSDEPRPGFNKWVSFKGQGVYFDPDLNIDGKRVKEKGHISDVLTNHAIKWLSEERDQDKPFFLYLSHKAVHAMFEPAKRHNLQYDKEPLEYPDSMADTKENYEGKPDWVKAQRNSWHGVDYMYHGQMDFDTFYKRYCETLLSVDESIGKLMNHLHEEGLDKSTLVMYMGDNGFCFGEHGLIDKRHMYEESMRVPMLAYCPDMIKPGLKIKQMVQNIDIAPTVLQCAGVEMPKHMDGMSIIPLLESKQVKWRDAVFYEYYWERNFPHTPTMHGVRTDRYKYIHYHGIWDVDELYDLKNDPEEMTNLIDKPEHQDLVIKLNKMMFDWLESTDGMHIPLYRDKGFRAVLRDPAKDKRQ